MPYAWSSLISFVIQNFEFGSWQKRELIFFFFFINRLKTWTRREGGIRLSEDEGPAASGFFEEDEFDEDNEELDQGDEPLALPVRGTEISGSGSNDQR